MYVLPNVALNDLAIGWVAWYFYLRVWSVGFLLLLRTHQGHPTLVRTIIK